MNADCGDCGDCVCYEHAVERRVARGVCYRELIEDVHTAVRQQFDSNQQTKAHSYIKYNSWADVCIFLFISSSMFSVCVQYVF